MINIETGDIESRRVGHTTDEFRKFIGDKTDTKIVIESCWNRAKTYELTKCLVKDVILAHPLKVKASASARVKTDAIYSRTLAQLLMANLIPEAHLRKADNRIKQRVIRHRAFLVALRTRVKNRINEIVNSQLLATETLTTKPKNLFAKRGKGENGGEWLKSLEWSRNAIQ